MRSNFVAGISRFFMRCWCEAVLSEAMLRRLQASVCQQRKKPRSIFMPQGFLHFVVRQLRLASLSEDFCDTEGEEGSQSKVDCLFFALVLQDQCVACLDKRSFAWIVDRIG